MLQFPYLLALLFGAFYALFLEFVPFGIWLVNRRTWMTVVGGVGAVMLIARQFVDPASWNLIALTFVWASGPVIGRSLIRELWEWNNEEKRPTAAKSRLPNKVIWGIEDIQSLCKSARPPLHQAIKQAEKNNNGKQLVALAQINNHLADIERKAFNARQIIYEE